MDFYYIIEFSDGEACFIISIYKKTKKKTKKDCKTGWWVIQTFTIQLPKKDASILYKIKALFGVVV